MKRFFIILLFFLIGFASLYAKPYQDIHMSVMLRTNVHNFTKNIWYPTISAALADASNNNQIYVYQGTYNESVTISGFTNLFLANYGYPITNVVIDASGATHAVKITNSQNIFLGGFMIQNASNGIFLANTTTASLVFNYITSNQKDGIRIEGIAQNILMESNNIDNNRGAGIGIWSSNADNNIVSGNIITRNAINGAGATGITIADGDNNIIINTRISNNYGGGIGLWGNPQNNRIQGNTIISNGYGSGISLGTTNYRNGSLSGNIVTNNIISKGSTGITIAFAKANKIVNNIISKHMLRGIEFREDGSTNILIEANTIRSNGQVGIQIGVTSILTNRLNTIEGHNIGIRYMAGTLRMVKNNIYNNTLLNFTNGTLTYLRMTNQWWGSTVSSTIASRIGNFNEYSNFTPYRLYGPYDITPGADTLALPIITSMTAMSAITTATLRWNQSPPASGFIRYSVYRSTNAGFTNLSRSQVITNLYSINATNFVDTPPKAGFYYYHVTALDDKFIYTNESWYSAQVIGVVGSYSIVAGNTNLNYTNIIFNTWTSSNVSLVSNDGTLDTLVQGQVNNFTNNAGLIPVWKVTNSFVPNGYNRVQLEYMTRTNGVVAINWTTVTNQQQIFPIHTNLPVGKTMQLYLRIMTPTSSTTLGPYRSRVRVQAYKP